MTTRHPPARKGSKSVLEVDGRSLPVSNLEKVLWPRDGFTKGDLIAYYRAVTPLLLPHVRGRPLTLERYPDGIDESSWWEKHVPRGLPDWVPTVVHAAEHARRAIEFIVCDDAATVVYVANLAAIVLHVWFSHHPTLDVPDFHADRPRPGRGLHARDPGACRAGGPRRVGHDRVTPPW